MNKFGEVLASLAALYRALPAARQRQLRWLVVLMIVAALSEMVSLVIVVPFLSLMSNTGFMTRIGWVSELLYSRLGFSNHEVIILVTSIFVAVTIISTAVRIMLNASLAKVNFRTGHEIGSGIFTRALYQNYLFHIGHNSAEIVANIAKVDIAVQVLQSVLVGVSSAFISACIVMTLLWVSPSVALIAISIFGGGYILISRLNHSRFLSNGRTINSSMPQRQRIVNESLGGIRDIILDHSQVFHSRKFDVVDKALRLAQENNQILVPLPRLLIEGLVMVVLALVCFWLTFQNGGLAAALPTVGVLILGGQRLLPMLQQTYQGWAMISGHLAVIEDLAKLVEGKKNLVSDTAEPTKKLEYQTDIRFNNVGFCFADNEAMVFQNVSFSIPKGSRVGIVGPTGGGKTTLLNLLMGLIEPTQGDIEVDGVKITDVNMAGWHRNIAHVPQSIYLADASIKENVALGTPPENIDVVRVREALGRAQLSAFIDTLPNGIDTIAGENGVRLSGGQRQRLGVARALYKQASVLVLDEATSALDEQTEIDLVRGVEALGRDITLIMIAHRMSTLRNCDFLLRVENNTVMYAGNSVNLSVESDLV